MSSGVKIALIVLGILVLLAVTCVGGLIGFGVWVTSQGPPEGIDVVVTGPESITQGDTFDFVVTITNELDRERTLKDIDFWSPLLDGVTVTDVDPTYRSYDDVIMSTYTFERAIPPEGQLVITFTMTADTPGTYRGDLDVSVDKMFSMFEMHETIRIQPAP